MLLETGVTPVMLAARRALGEPEDKTDSDEEDRGRNFVCLYFHYQDSRLPQEKLTLVIPNICRVCAILFFKRGDNISAPQPLAATLNMAKRNGVIPHRKQFRPSQNGTPPLPYCDTELDISRATRCHTPGSQQSKGSKVLESHSYARSLRS